jgi:membrane-associated HD superfamily phosphohydrolase
VESGIIALADSIESASRTIRKPSPAKIRGLIEDIVQSRIADGQLDECALTMRELARVKESFANTLRCMLHSRIDYPKEDESKSATTKRGDSQRAGLGVAERELTRGGRALKPGEAA